MPRWNALSVLPSSPTTTLFPPCSTCRWSACRGPGAQPTTSMRWPTRPSCARLTTPTWAASPSFTPGWAPTNASTPSTRPWRPAPPPRSWCPPEPRRWPMRSAISCCRAPSCKATPRHVSPRSRSAAPRPASRLASMCSTPPTASCSTPAPSRWPACPTTSASRPEKPPRPKARPATSSRCTSPSTCR